MKNVLGIILGVILTSLIISSCNRIDAGHVGIKVKLYGTEKGVQDVTEVTGWVFYNPFSTSVYEFPTFIQHKEYFGDDSFVINSHDGSEFPVAPMINYSVDPRRVPEIFKKYRKELPQLEEGFIKIAVYDAFRIAANSYTADSLISFREKFEAKVRVILEKQLTNEGFIVHQFTSNLEYPKSFKTAIEAKNNAVQNAMTAENKVKEAEANARIAEAKAIGIAKSLVAQATAEATAYALRQKSLTPLLIQQQFIEKWNGVLPVYGTVPQLFRDVNK